MVNMKVNFIMEASTVNPDQTALIWVHIACSMGYQSTSADERANNNFDEWLEKGQAKQLVP